MADIKPVIACTKDSETVEKMKLADKLMSDKKGISFYCSKRHEFIFIENSRDQSNHVKRMVPKIKPEISSFDIKTLNAIRR